MVSGDVGRPHPRRVRRDRRPLASRSYPPTIGRNLPCLRAGLFVYVRGDGAMLPGLADRVASSNTPRSVPACRVTFQPGRTHAAGTSPESRAWGSQQTSRGLPIPEPAGTPRRDDKIDVAGCRTRATEPARPLRHREILAPCRSACSPQLRRVQSAKSGRRFSVPTIVRSPYSTLKSCGRLSIRVHQRNAPTGVTEGEPGTGWTLAGMAFGTEAKQLKFTALRPPLFPLREHRAGAVQLDGKRYDDHQRQGNRDQNDSD